MKQTNTPFPTPQTANRKSFIDPFNTKETVAYYHRIFEKYAYASNFGLALDDDDQGGADKRPVMLEDMFVPPALTTHALTSHALMEADRKDKKIQGMSNISGMLQQHPWMFVLGDPGTGKSTLITWLMMTLRYSGSHQLKHQVGSLVPFALILRDLNLQQVQDWDSLWQAFVSANDDLMKPMMNGGECCQMLTESGQAIFLIDGLDEVSSPQIRRALAAAVKEGLQRFPCCKFIITSRIIGFSQSEWFGYQQTKDGQARDQQDCEDDLALIEKGRDLSTKAFEGLPVLYLAPFDQGKQHQFVVNWYRQYVPDQSSHASLVGDLLSRLSKHDGLSELARIPVLLNMICFIHARRGRLPDGRAELYERIAETYLVTLDSARRIQFKERDMRVDYEDISEGLAHLALSMQQQRGEANETIHIARSKVEACFRALLIEQGLKEKEAQEETGFILDFIAHRSGLFIPRGEVDGEMHYAFSHLSFLEYFAGKELMGSMIDMHDDADWDQWRKKLHQPIWHEVIALWFELLPKKSVKRCVNKLFGESGEKLEAEESNGWLLLSEIAMNSAVRLSGEQRCNWIESSWRHLLGPALQGKYWYEWQDSEQSWLGA
ncbi:MAG: NACHT domain-containing protein, partial [Mariprofundaceae bacterium]|nr:NACHT domain-containing protein [Mariprofundaceae bacterium]